RQSDEKRSPLPHEQRFKKAESLLPRQALHIFGLWPFFAVDHLEADFFFLVQNLVALPQNRGMVDKNILSGFLGDEAKAPSVVEPFHFSTGHKIYPSVSKRDDRKPQHLIPIRRACFRSLLHTSKDYAYRKI